MCDACYRLACRRLVVRSADGVDVSAGVLVFNSAFKADVLRIDGSVGAVRVAAATAVTVKTLELHGGGILTVGAAGVVNVTDAMRVSTGGISGAGVVGVAHGALSSVTTTLSVAQATLESSASTDMGRRGCSSPVIVDLRSASWRINGSVTTACTVNVTGDATSRVSVMPFGEVWCLSDTAPARALHVAPYLSIAGAVHMGDCVVGINNGELLPGTCEAPRSAGAAEWVAFIV